MSARAFSVHGSFDIDARNAFTEIVKIREVAREVARDLKTVSGTKIDIKTGGTDAGLKKVSEGAKKATESLSKQKREAADWARQIEAENKRAGVSINRFGDVVKNMTRDQRESLDQQKREGAAWAREIDRTYNRSGVTINRFGEQVKTVTGHLGDLTREQRQALTAQQRDAESWARQIESDMKRAGNAVDRYGDRMDKAQRDSKRRAARSELGRKAGDAASLAGAGILAGLGAATKTSVEFSQAMRNVNSIAQLSEEQLESLKASVVDIARDPQILAGPRGLSESLYDVYSSGFEGAQALEVLRQAAQGAAAGNTDAATSGKVLMATLNSGIPGVKSAAESMDVLFKIVDRGVVSFPELSGSLGAILPTAAKAGVSLQQVGAGVALMTKSGQSASEATNDLLNLLNKVANPGKQAAEQFDKLGISYGFSALQAKGLPGVLEEIQKKTGGNADAIKKLLPDMQAQRAALSLLKNGGKEYVSELAEMEKASEGVGAKTKALNEQLKGEGAGIANFKKNIEILSITAGDVLLPALNDVLENANELFELFSQLHPETQKNIVKWTAAAGVLLLVGGRVHSVIEMFVLLKNAQIATAAAAGTSAATTATAWKALAVKGGALALVLATIWGIRTAFIGSQDAGTMAADQLKEKWGFLADVWIRGSDALNSISNRMQRIYNSKAFKALETFSPHARVMGEVGRRSSALFATEGADGAHADGLPYVPKDGYKAILHKGEMVLTATEAATWRAQNKRSASSATAGRSMLGLARGYLGMRGDDPRAAQLLGSAYGEEWCVGFLRGVAKKAGSSKWPGTNSVSGLRSWGAKQGLSYTGTPRVGDAFTIKGKDISHAGLVTGVRNGRFTTIGGNEGSKNNYASRVKENQSYSINDKRVVFIRTGSGGMSEADYAKDVAKAEKERLAAIQRRLAASNRDAASIKERNALLKFEAALLRDSSLSMEEVNVRLEDETNRRRRIKDLVESGYTEKQAEAIAHVRLGQERSNRAVEKSNELLKEQRTRTLEIIKAGEERMTRRVEELASMREHSALLAFESTLLGDQTKTLREVNRELEVEEYLRSRIAHWKSEGYSETQAKTLAGQDTETFKSDRATKDENEARKQARQNRIEEASQAGAALQQLKDASIRTNFETINALMNDTELSVETIAATLSELQSRIGRGELLPLAMPDAKQIEKLFGIGEQNDMKARLGELGGRIGGEGDGALSALFAQFEANRDPLDIAADRVKNLRAELNELKDVAAARGVDMSGFVKNFEYWEQLLDGIVPKLKQARDLANVDALKKQLANEELNLKLRELEVAGQLTDAKRLELTWAADTRNVSAEELELRRQILALMERTAAVQPADTRVADYIRDVQNRVRLAGIADPIERELENIRQQLGSQGWTNEQIQAVLPTARLGMEAENASSRILSTMEGLKGELGALWGNLREKGISSFGDLFNGILNQFYRFADDILTQAVWGQLSGLLGGGKSKGSFTPGIAGPIGSIANGFIGSALNGLSFGGAFASGLDVVPKDGFVGVLHKGEAVLNAQAARAWRNQQRMMATGAGSSNPAMVAGTSSGGGSPNIIVQGDLVVKDARSPQSTARKIYGAARSRAEMRRGFALAAT